jgi:isoleucyl-tRNA synthetase
MGSKHYRDKKVVGVFVRFLLRRFTYVTYKPKYMETVWWILKQIYNKI